jgi:hypothetical protein
MAGLAKDRKRGVSPLGCGTAVATRIYDRSEGRWLGAAGGFVGRFEFFLTCCYQQHGKLAGGILRIGDKMSGFGQGGRLESVRVDTIRLATPRERSRHAGRFFGREGRVTWRRLVEFDGAG